jgi:hypothetical protein
MADGREQTGAFSYRTALPWTHIFRCFQIALDPRKLFVAALGILAMSILWYVLSAVFWYKAPNRDGEDYSKEYIKKVLAAGDDPKTGQPWKTEDLDATAAKEAQDRYDRDYAQWQQLDALAGPGGRLRTLPWYEYRGPNPFLFGTDLIGGSAADREKAVVGFFGGSVPVLVEPLVKMLLPVAKLVSPGVSTQTRLYLFLILLSNVAVWAFCGGVITRLAAVQLANKGPISLGQAVNFVAQRYTSYLGAPLVPIAIIAAVVFGLIIYSFVALIPILGDVVLFGFGLPIVLAGGAIMTVFLIGLIGYPMMYCTLSAEGDQSDTIDALSRSVNYVYQAPWQYLWNWLVAVVYGAAVTLFVLFFASVAVYVGKWGAGLTASVIWPERKPEYLFIYAPESFGWRELLTKDSPYAIRGEWTGIDRDGNETSDPARTVRQVMTYKPVKADAFAAARADFYYHNTWGAGIVCFLLTLAFLMMLGFSYSFFWSAATVIYFLMRKKVDDAEMDEVFEETEPEAPLAPPKLAAAPTASETSPTSLPVIQAPPAPPSPAETLPFTPPTAPPADAPPASDAPPK